MLALKLTTIGKSAGLIFPKEALSRLKVQKGDTLFLTETKEGYLLTPYDPEFGTQMREAEDVMSRYRNTLKELAK
jgi:putative addiction module antidote